MEANDPGEAAHLREIVATIHEDGVTRWRIQQRTGFGGQDLDVMRQQRESRQDLDRGLLALGQQEQVRHVATSVFVDTSVVANVLVCRGAVLMKNGPW